MDADTVDMEVSIRGSAFSNDPDLLLFEETGWRLPNPSAYPDGLDLLPGENVILVRSVAANGSVSTPAALTVILLRDSDLGVVAPPPTDIDVVRLDASVRINVAAIDDTNFAGLNFYATAFAGGGVTGYSRINLDTVIDAETVAEVTDLAAVSQSYDIATDSFGDHAADPLFLKFVGTQVDADDTEIQEDFVERIEVPEFITSVTTSIAISQVREFQRLNFVHNRTSGPNSSPPTVSIGAFSALAVTEPLFYVVTAVYFDSTTLVETESSYSIEVVGTPLRVTTAVGNLPVVSRQQLTRDFMASIFRSSPHIKMEAGSVLRDTVIDPFTSEAERIRFIVDFLHRAQSFASLLSVDDPENTGTSVEVSASVYKTALKRAFSFTRDADVQAVIDRAFEQLASNVHKFRVPGRFSRGEVTFFTTVLPTRTIPIPLGTLVSAGSQQYRTTTASELPLDNIASFRDPTTGRYLVRVSVQATNPGVRGNVGSGQVRRIVSAIAGLSVTNESAFFGGTDIETNKQLSERALNAVAGVDTGTARGYLQTVAEVPGVIQAKVVGALDPLMQRDFDTATGEHRGGKVEIWIQGDNTATVTDTFAFQFDLANNIQFELRGVPSELEFLASDPLLSEANPIVELLDFPDAGLEFRNATTGESFDITGAVITGYNTVRLDNTLVQPAVSLTDVVLGDYRRRTTNEFPLPRQPVRSVTTVAGSVSGTLPPEAYELVHPSSPLDEGRSSLAGDFLSIIGTTDSAGDPIPSGDFIPVTDEPHVLIGEFNEPLDNLGVNFFTIVVTNVDGTITYRGPNDPSGVSDYTIVVGSATVATSIRRIPSGDIASGQAVLVDYQHDENFVVRYEVNLVVQTAQDEVDETKHLTADVVVKDGIPGPIDISATIVLDRGQVQSTVDQAIRTNLTNLFAGLRLGQPLRQGDIIAVLDNTSGVSFPVVPLTKMVRAEGSLVPRESLVSGQAGDSTYLSALSTATVSTWIVEDALANATSDNGGPDNEFRGVYQDGFLLALAKLPVTTVGLTPGISYIIGLDGLSIPGYSDDQTLEDQGFTTPEEKQAQRRNLTANRIIVTTEVSDSPSNHAYAVDYVVGVDTGAKNHNPSSAEYLTLGTLDFTFDEDR
jgi:hypothetical protein